MTRTWIARGGIAVVALMGLAFLIGSFGDGASSIRNAAGVGAQPGAFEGDAVTARGMGAPLDGEALADEAIQPAPDAGFGDRVIRSADLAVEVAEGTFAEAWDRAADLASRFDGSVMSSTIGRDVEPFLRARGERDDAPFGTLTIRVPFDRFDEALAAMRGLGDVRRERTTSQDVTEEFVDLQSRLRHLRAQEDVLLRLMARAESVQDTIAVQRELAQIQAEMERIRGRLAFLEARTEFSTISLTVAEPDAFATTTATTDGPSFAQAWETALVGLQRMATAAMILALWAAPFAAIGALVIWARRGRRPAPQP